MEPFVLWIGFVGAWLLFAGPIYQAALELQDEDIELDRIRATGAAVERPAKVSIWWWLLPPVKLCRELKNRHEYEYRYLKALHPEDVEAMVSFRSKTTGWLFVAVGGLCLACKETYELAHHMDWGMLAFIALTAVMALLSILNLILRVKRAALITSFNQDQEY